MQLVVTARTGTGTSINLQGTGNGSVPGPEIFGPPGTGSVIICKGPDPDSYSDTDPAIFVFDLQDANKKLI